MVGPRATDFVDFLSRTTGAFTWNELSEIASPRAVRSALSQGLLHRAFRNVYVSSTHAESFATRAAAASRWRNHTDALSGASALFAWELIDVPPQVELVSTRSSGVKCPDWVRVKRVSYSAPHALWHSSDTEIPVVLPAFAIATAWGSLPSRARSAVVYEALQRRVTTVADLQSAAHTVPRIRDRRALLDMVDAARNGAESHLEAHAHRHIFSGVEFRAMLRQHKVRVAGKSFRLDMYHPRTKTAIELDGAAFHGQLGQRERDVNRDAVLAAHGILTIRLTYRDVTSKPDWCRDMVRGTIASRL